MVHFLKSLSNVVDKLSRALIVLLFALSFAGTLYQVFSRYVLQNVPSLSFPWMEEAVRYAFVWIVFLGIGFVYKLKGHAQVEILNHYLPDRWRRRFQWMVEIINSLFFIVLFLKGFEMLQITNGQLSPSLHLNMAWMYTSILCCTFICFIHSLHFLAEHFTSLKTPFHVGENEDGDKADQVVNQ